MSIDQHRCAFAFSVILFIAAACLPVRSGCEIVASPEKTHREVITTGDHGYTLEMRGTVDAENSTTRLHGGWETAFQPNIALVMENTGDIPVENPRIVINDQRNWWTLDDLLEEALRGARTDQDKIYFIWDFLRRNRHHAHPVFEQGREAWELHDPVTYLNVYGAGFCDDSGSVGAMLYHAAGLNGPDGKQRPFVRALHGHMMCEVFAGDNADAAGWQFMDIDEGAFYLDRENKRPVSGDELARDHDLARREFVFGTVFSGWNSGERAAAFFGADDERTTRLGSGREIRFRLRPGEKIEYRWDNVGKFPASRPDIERRYYGNSLVTYRPRLSRVGRRYSVADEGGLGEPTVPGAAVSGSGRLAWATIEMETPYPVCGGRVRADFVGRDPADRFGIDVSLDSETWYSVFEEEGDGERLAQIELDPWLDVKKAPPKRRFYVRTRLMSANGARSANLQALVIEADVMVSPEALPRLRLGQNRVVYTDETNAHHEMTITHVWQECDSVVPPDPPQLAYPGDGTTVCDSTLTFRWQPVPDVSRYHIQVSQRQDMRIPCRSSFDAVVAETDFGIPFTGIFAPDTPYYWRVRTQDKDGVWGKWSHVSMFGWEGPRVPVNVRRTLDGSTFGLHWEPNPRGTRPVRYKVYGSNEKGFSVSDEPYEVVDLGKRPANLVGITANTSMKVVGLDLHGHGYNKCFYRVVAVDEHGTESGCSDYVEMPHPFFYSQPVTEARVGEQYAYAPGILTSLGDLQHHYEEPKYKYWDVESYTFSLLSGPPWLRIDRDTGRLTGVPSAEGVGAWKVVISATNQFGANALHSYEIAVTGL